MSKPAIVDIADTIRLAIGHDRLEADPVYGSFGRAYFPAVFGDRSVDTSFAVADGDTTWVLVECNVLDGQLNRYGFPIRLEFAADLPGRERARATRLAFAELDRLAETHGIETVVILETAPGDAIDVVGEACLNRKGTPTIEIQGRVDLSLQDGAYRSRLRKSYRSLVNWGHDNMIVSLVNQTTPDRETFAAYQSLHRTVAGKVTRAQESWDIMFDHIARGFGEVVLARIGDDEPVAGALVIDGTDISVYVSAAYDHARSDKPLAHWPLYQAIANSRRRGRRWFDLGAIPAFDDADTRGYNVGHFKKGFVTELRRHIVWRYGPNADSHVAAHRRAAE